MGVRFIDADHREWDQELELVSAVARDEQRRDARAAEGPAGPGEKGWKRCGCGVSSPHPYCPECGARLRPARSAVEAAWIVNHGLALLPADRRLLDG